MEKVDDNNYVNDMYFLFYNMIYETLQTENVFEGLDKALYFLKIYLNSGDIVLYRKDSDGLYRCFANQALMKNSIDPISCIVNKTSKLVEAKKAFFIDLNLSENLKNIMLFHIKINTTEYMMAIDNLDTKIELNSEFEKKLNDTLSIILNRAEMHEKQTIAINEDALTKLKNRTAYEKRMKSIDENDEELVYGLFDLFRLKFVNDKYSHSLGDKYIIEAANILRKYWPEEKVEIQQNNSKLNVKTGHELYRVGGDEFILITTKEKLELTKIKASLVSEEVSLIDLGVKEDLPIGLNFGLVKHSLGGLVKREKENADALMQEEKDRMYLKYGLERRR